MNIQTLTSTSTLDQQPTIELIAQLVGAPSADALLRTYGTLSEMARGTEIELAHLAGVTARRARQVKAALLLAQRLTHECQPERPMLDSPEKIADLLREENRTYKVECFQLALLNVRKRLIRVIKVSQGTLDTLLVHPRDVFRHAILLSAASVVLIHNHPSSDPAPSDADVRVTRDLIRAGQLLKIEVLDHIILGAPSAERPKDYASLREMGYFCA